MDAISGEVRLEVVDPGSPEAVAALHRYFAELDRRFPTGFDPGDALTEDRLQGFRAPDGAFVVMVHGRQPIGCGGVQRLDDETSEIKRMWVDPEWRGRGLGTWLLSSLEDLARASGRPRLVLDTNASLHEAITMYARSGFRQIAAYNTNPDAHHWFEKLL